MSENQVHFLDEGFNMYETDPGAYGHVTSALSSVKTNFAELAICISVGRGQWNLFLTSRGLFYIAKMATTMRKVPKPPPAFSLATMSYVKSKL